MSDKTRDVYAEVVNTSWINPFVTFKLRVSEVNKINYLVERNTPKPIVKDGYDDFDSTEKKFACPHCGERIHDDENFCKWCGQALDTENYAL